MENQRIFETSELEKGKAYTYGTKTWIFLGANEKDAFFRNIKSRKYPSYTWNRNGTVDLLNMTKMDCTIDELKRAHGF